ncbi:DMT family transporter [Streptomyces chattanoogensis]|uniref:DMT family transporter n=1 Tax=Streptomyces chattanoogensis TaxID=66876 RepID=UPI003677D413
MLWWGVASALLANVLYSTGFVLEKRALSALPALSTRQPARVVRHLLGSPLWIGGSLALAAGFAAQLAVYRTLPIAAAQGIFVSGLVLLLLLSSAVLGERTSGRERQSIVAILVALVMVVVSLQGSDARTIARTAPPATLLAIALPSLAAGLLLYGSAERRARRRHRLPTAGVPYGVAVGLLYGVSSLAIKGVSGLLTTDHIPAAVAQLFRSPYPYLLLFTGATGLVLSQTALQRCRASVIVPVCSTITCVFTVACGTVAFGEPLPADPLRLALRLGGTAVALTVLLALPRHEPAAPAPHTPAPPAAEAPPALPAPPAPEASATGPSPCATAPGPSAAASGQSATAPGPPVTDPAPGPPDTGPAPSATGPSASATEPESSAAVHNRPTVNPPPPLRS